MATKGRHTSSSRSKTFLLSFEVFQSQGDRTPPTEFRIFPYGKVETSKGTFTFDTDAARSVLAAWADQGNTLCLDYDHQMVEGEGQAPAAGWFELDIRDDGLWATKLRWTPKATDYLKQAEYRYFSPAFKTDEKNRITKLINVALTNLPATKNMEPLVAASAKGNAMKKPSNFSKFLARKSNEMGLSASDMLSELEIDADDTDAMSHAKMKALAGKVGCKVSDILSALDDVDADDVDADDVDADETTDDVDADEATDDVDADEATKATKISTKDLVALTGRSTKAEAMGVIKAWEKSHKSVTTLKSRVDELEGEQRRRDVLELVAEGEKSGRLQRPQREWAIKTGMDNITTLKAFLEVAQPGGPASFKSPRAPASGTVTLSEEEKGILIATGQSLEEGLKAKQNMIAQGGAPCAPIREN